MVGIDSDEIVTVLKTWNFLAAHLAYLLEALKSSLALSDYLHTSTLTNIWKIDSIEASSTSVGLLQRLC